MFIPAASARSYFFFSQHCLSLQAVQHSWKQLPIHISILGPKETSEQRLNFAQSFNGVGAFLAPILGGQFILTGIEHSKEELQSMSSTQLNAYLQSEANTVQIPYLVMACIVIFVGILFLFTKLPDVKEPDADVHGTEFNAKVLRHPHLFWAVVAQFFYVGAQVGVGSFFITLYKICC